MIRTSPYHGAMAPLAERVASNEARFAAANDEIALMAATLSPRRAVPFLCECPTAHCSELAELSLGEYAALRLFPNRFVISAACRGGDVGGTQIVERTPHYTIVDRPTD
jgi:hypothetical protein